MKIVSLQAENIKRLRAVEIIPQGNMIVVGGKNGHGKTSLLDSIWFALGGKDALPEMPVRNGQKNASVELKLDNGIVVRRRIDADRTTKLEVLAGDGFTAPKPQELLNGLVGALTFDPLQFATMPAKEQLGVLKRLVGLDFTSIDADRQARYDERTHVNRSLKQLEGQLAGLPRHEDAPAEEQSADELLARMQEATKVRELKTEKAGQLANYDFKASVFRNRIAEREATIAKLQEENRVDRDKLALGDLRREALQAEHDALSIPDVGNAEQELKQIETTNAKVRQNRERAKVEAQLEAQRADSKRLTDAMDAIDEQKRTALQAATFPVPGLSFNESGVLLNGIPFTQASAAEKLRVSLAMGIALNPKLKIMLIREGEKLDEENLALVAQHAAEHDAQVWIERVGTGAEVSVVIEDGGVKEDRQVAPAHAAPA